MNSNGKFTAAPGLIPQADGVNWRLDNPLEFVMPTGETILVPAGFQTDLASIPPLGLVGGTIMVACAFILGAAYFWNWLAWVGLPLFVAGYFITALSPYLKAYGRYTYSAVLHDWIFQSKAYPFTVCNWILLMAMKSENTAWWERSLIWFNVQVFGYGIYKRDKKPDA